MSQPADSRMQFVKRFSEIGIGDIPIVGGKNASLGEMYRELTSHGIRVPTGFAVCSARGSASGTHGIPHG